MRHVVLCLVVGLVACVAPAGAAPGGPRVDVVAEVPEDLTEAALLASGFEAELARKAARGRALHIS